MRGKVIEHSFKICKTVSDKTITFVLHTADKHEQSTSDKTVVIKARLITGFFYAIVSIIVISMLLKRHFSWRILRTEKKTLTLSMSSASSRNSTTSRESANNVRPGRYNILHLNIWIFITNLKLKREVKILILSLWNLKYW